MKTEILEDLKIIWKEVEEETQYGSQSLGEELAKQWKGRLRKVVIKFALELGLCLMIYIGAILVIIQGPSDHASRMFGLKIVLLSLVFFLPVGASLYQSLLFWKKADFTRPIKTYVDDSIEKLIQFKVLYARYAYLFSAFMIIMLLTDDFFGEKSVAVKAGTFAFIAATVIMVKPYLRLIYGKDLSHFEDIKKEMSEE